MTPMLPILSLLAFSLVVFNIIVVAKRINYVNWQKIRRKRYVPRREIRNLWLTVWALIILGLALIFMMVKLDLLR